MEGIEKLMPVVLAGAMAVVSLHVFPFSPSSKNGNRIVAKNSDSGEDISDLEEDAENDSVKPVSVQWKNLTCALMDKSGRLVCLLPSNFIDIF